MKAVTEKEWKTRYLIDAQFSTDKKLATTQERQTLQIPMKSNIVSIESYLWLFLPDFPQIEIACWNSYVSYLS